MAIQDRTDGGAGAARPFVAERNFVVEKILKTADLNEAALDVLELIDVKAGQLVNSVAVTVKTAEGGVATADVGDGTDPNGYMDAVDLNVVATTEDTGAYAGGKLYAADDTIDMTLDHALDAAVVHVFANITDFSVQS